MDGVTTAFPNRKLHVILDSLNTHKRTSIGSRPSQCAISFHADQRVLAQSGRVWFSILQGQSLSGGTCPEHKTQIATITSKS
jgi:hypothetical protein